MGVAPQPADLSAIDFYELAADRLAMGEPPAALEQEFVARGLDPDDARRVVETAAATRQANRIASGRRNMIFGGSAIVVAAGVSALTYLWSPESGGIFIIFPIATIFGAIQFVWGWSQIRGA